MELVFAYFLIVGNVDDAVDDSLFWLCPHVNLLTIHLELVDVREMSSIFIWPREFHHDVGVIRSRYAELKDIPKIGDCHRFPSREFALNMLGFNRLYCRDVEQQKLVDFCFRHEKWAEILGDAERRYLVWDTVADFQCEHYYLTVRRHSLAHLKALIGPADYYAGQLPASVPTWALEEAAR